MEQDASPMPDPNDLRLAANARFAANALDEALPLYSLAVEVASQRIGIDQQPPQQQQQEEPTDELVIHLCNLSACLYKMEMYKEACHNAAEAVSVSGGQNLKALFRLARAQLATKEYSSAMETIQQALSRCDEELQQYEQQQIKAAAASDSNDDTNVNSTILQRKEFEKLKVATLREQGQQQTASSSQDIIQSIKLEPRTPSIKEFTRPNKSSDSYSPLGNGNFSTVVICQHKVTNETFALKIIEKEECKKLAKRQHPNVFNEVAMERRILTQKRLPTHVNLIKCYHAMQDYGNLYFLMDLHHEHGDLWSKLRYQKCMVGCHSSLIRVYVYELLSALEHCHRHGIVHRDVKPENILLSEQGGHVILIDFGTAKDLIVTDLNGPEFVGTPDFMSPEAVKEPKEGSAGSDFTVDLWALGVVIYQLYAGALPFESQSPYLGFLKIQRGVNVGRNMGVWDDDAWDLIQKLLKANPKDRLGAGCFEWIPPSKVEKNDANGEKKNTEQGEWFDEGQLSNKTDESNQQQAHGKIIRHENGYDIIRQHPFFAKQSSTLLVETNSHLKSDSEKSIHQPIPSLRDLAIRATAHFIDQSSLDVNLDDLHPPGDNSSYDALRLKPSDRRRVMHLLDRLHILKEPRVYRRFFSSKQDARLGRIRPESRDVIGLTQVNDKMGHFRGVGEDQPHPELQLPTDKLIGNTKTTIHHITNPLFRKSINDQCSGDDDDGVVQRKEYIKQLKESIRLVNRVRPTVVIACGYFDDSCRKLLSKVNETVPVILHDGSSFFNFWVYGAHCVAIPLRYLRANVDGDGEDNRLRNEALAWFRMELEQIKMARSHGYVFVDGDPREIPNEWITKMGKSHILGLLGLCNGPNDDTNGEGGVVGEASEQSLRFETVYSVSNCGTDDKANKIGREIEDDISTSSSDSDAEDSPEDAHVLHIVGRIENGVRCITVQEEELVWDVDVLL